MHFDVSILSKHDVKRYKSHGMVVGRKQLEKPKDKHNNYSWDVYLQTKHFVTVACSRLTFQAVH